MSSLRRLLLLGLLGAAAAALPGLLSAGGTVRASHWPDGTPQQEVTYEDGFREGPATYWYADGTLRARGTWADDVREGPWEFWGPDGRPDLERTGRYHRGDRVEP
jgi:antitoxin component YwqK of YwqJK toxin-antitoxin module